MLEPWGKSAGAQDARPERIYHESKFAHVTKTGDITPGTLSEKFATYQPPTREAVGEISCRANRSAAGSDSGMAIRDASSDSVPVITGQPSSRTVLPGTALSFDVTADTGGALVTYQWRKDGVPINGATSNRLTLLSVTAQDAGKYDVTVTDRLGSLKPGVYTFIASAKTGSPGIVLIEVYDAD